MVRKFINLDGEVLTEEEWTLNENPRFRCFWCDDRLLGSEMYTCPFSFDGSHDWVTVCNREFV